MTVICKSSLFGILLLGTITSHKFWLSHCYHQLEEDKSTHDPVSSNLVGALKNILAGIEQVISGALDVVLDDGVNRAGETTESNLVAINRTWITPLVRFYSLGHHGVANLWLLRFPDHKPTMPSSDLVQTQRIDINQNILKVVDVHIHTTTS